MFFISRTQRWTHKAWDFHLHSGFTIFFVVSSARTLARLSATSWLTSFVLRCYVIGLLNWPQANHKHNRERNVVRMWAAVSLGGALRDIPKNGCEGDYRLQRISKNVHFKIIYPVWRVNHPNMFSLVIIVLIMWPNYAFQNDHRHGEL